MARSRAPTQVPIAIRSRSGCLSYFPPTSPGTVRRTSVRFPSLEAISSSACSRHLVVSTRPGTEAAGHSYPEAHSSLWKYTARGGRQLVSYLSPAASSACRLERARCQRVATELRSYERSWQLDRDREQERMTPALPSRSAPCGSVGSLRPTPQRTSFKSVPMLGTRCTKGQAFAWPFVFNFAAC